MSETRNATPAVTLEQRIMDPCVPKSEAEWWAHREVERLRADRRERIATAALNGLIANAVVAHTPDVLALAAVVIADAMIAELDKDEGKP